MCKRNGMKASAYVQRGCIGHMHSLPYYRSLLQAAHAAAPVLCLHGIKDHGALAPRFTGRMCAEPVVWEHSIWCAMREVMLKQIDLHPGTLQITHIPSQWLSWYTFVSKCCSKVWIDACSVVVYHGHSLGEGVSQAQAKLLLLQCKTD